MQMPGDIGPFHIVGIGGIGMSAIAEVLHIRGFAVRGSDIKQNANVTRLQAMGIPCVVGHKAENVAGAEFVVVSSAVKADNLEVEAARASGIAIIHRAEMLAELMRGYATISVTGTHGKTTTTSIIAELLDSAKLDPTVLNGGIINAYGSNARIGAGSWMVVEADESDGTFTKLPTQIGVVTNIDAEHMDYWVSIEALHAAFRSFFNNIPFYGLVVAGLDHPIVREMIATLRREEAGRRVLTYGFADDADLRIANFRADGGATLFDVDMGPDVRGGPRALTDLRLPMPGDHNALNALAGIAVASEIGIADEKIREALAGFGGVKRRFTHIGTWNGVDVYDDYAHHPVEIASVLNAAKSASRGQVFAVVQPHRYSRLQSLFGEFCTCFGDADSVIVTPVYSAGEVPIEGIDRDALIEGIKRQGHGHVVAVEDEHELIAMLGQNARPGDLVIGLGAGTITEWINTLPQLLNGTSAPGDAA